MGQQSLSWEKRTETATGKRAAPVWRNLKMDGCTVATGAAEPSLGRDLAYTRPRDGKELVSYTKTQAKIEIDNNLVETSIRPLAIRR